MALPVEYRLRRPAEFKRVLDGAGRSGRRGMPGGRARDNLLMIAGMPADGTRSRVGLSVSKRVGKSVVRNRVKRRLREIFRELVVVVEKVNANGGPGGEQGWDFVATARPDAAEATYVELRNSAEGLISKVKAGR